MAPRKWKAADLTFLKVVEDRLAKRTYEKEKERLPKDFSALQTLEMDVEIPAEFRKRIDNAKLEFEAFLKPAEVVLETKRMEEPVKGSPVLEKHQTPEERIAEIQQLLKKQPEVYQSNSMRRTRNRKFLEEKRDWILKKYKETDDPADPRKVIGKDPQKRLKILRDTLQKLSDFETIPVSDQPTKPKVGKEALKYLQEIRDRLEKNVYKSDEDQRKTNIALLKRKIDTAAKRVVQTEASELDIQHTDLLAALEGYETKDSLLEAWEKEEDLEKRNQLLETLQRRGIQPKKWSESREKETGLYPDIQNSEFPLRIAKKSEFADLRSKTATDDVCGSSKGFDTTPVQRLVARFLHPKTPYRSVLLDHGVGVGKTCTAITIAEAFLEKLPQRKVIILCPQAIASGFKRTIFDPDRIVAIPPREAQLRGEVWESFQCTGMNYLRLTGMAQEQNIEEVTRKVTLEINRRYTIMGYLAFANKVTKKLKKHIPKDKVGEERMMAENAWLYKYFSDRLLIIDEAHNLRDSTATASGDLKETATEAEEAPNPVAARDAAEGKQLTPILKRVLSVAEGLRLVMMTATPMYNTAPEILFLLNLMILNDTKSAESLLNYKSFFSNDGSVLPSAHKQLQTLCGRYVSYMRGENPASFPLRLTPPSAVGPAFFESQYPTVSISKKEGTVKMSEESKRILSVLPIVVHKTTPTSSAVGKELHRVLEMSKTEGEAREVSDLLLGQTMQISNITYPDGSNGSRGWELYWRPQLVGKTHQFLWTPPEDQKDKTVDDVFTGKGLASHSPKISAIVDSAAKAKGMVFIFSQFVKAGALPVAVALERSGWTRVLSDGSPAPITSGLSPVSRQCALCPHKEHQKHTGHTFMPANFVLLTGSDLLSPDFKGTLAYANTLKSQTDIVGGKVKAIVGSQVASEGLDLKCIRENHILDSWYHLNRIEQIIGRAVRYCSHAALPIEERNCLLYMHCISIPKYETADLYAYRLAARKAVPIGEVQRIIKTSSWDCLMNRDAILLKGLRKRRIVDAQGRVIPQYDPHDKPYTSICDFQEVCEYECSAGKVDFQHMKDKDKDTSTYEGFNAKRRFMDKEKYIRKLFEKEIALPIDFLKKTVYGDMPWEVGSMGLRALLQNPTFIIQRKDGARGTLELKNGYVVFKPLGVTDETLPLALRYGYAFGKIPKSIHLNSDVLLDYGEEEVQQTEVKKPAAKKKAEKTTEKEEVEAEAEAEAEVDAEEVPKLVKDALASLQKWRELLDTVLDSDMSVAIRAPTELPKQFFEGARWVLHNFADLPETRKIAERWWMDMEWSISQRNAVLAYLLKHPEAEPGLREHFRPVELFTGALSGYFAVDEQDAGKTTLKTYCSLEDEGIKACPPNLQKIVQTIVGNPVDRMEDTGPLFGFVIPIKTLTTFKSVDKKEKITGAQCGNTSNLTSHHSRIEQIQNELWNHYGEDEPIMNMILSSGTEGADIPAAERKKRQEQGTLKHIKDLSKNHSCFYMEFLLRWMDMNRVDGKRWFLSVVDAMRAGYKAS